MLRPSHAFFPLQASGRSSDGEQKSGSGQAQAERVRRRGGIGEMRSVNKRRKSETDVSMDEGR